MSSSLQDKLSRWLDVQLHEAENVNPSSSYFSIEDSFLDQTTQSPVSTDTPITVKLGPAKTSPSGIVSVDADGVLSVLKTGPLFVKTRISLGRIGSTGTSVLHLWIEISSDGGTTWAVSGNVVDVKLDNSTDTDTFFDNTPVFLPAGAKARTRFARSSLGHNSGDIVPGTLSPTLQAYGLVPSASAQVTVYKSNNWNYV